jgi:hypothetical protein
LALIMATVAMPPHVWAAQAKQGAHPAPETAAQPSKRANEMSLAGLRPGRSTMADAQKMYGNEPRKASNDDDKDAVTWEEPCQGRWLRVETDDSGVIQFITVQAEEHPADCNEPGGAARKDAWRTGHGIGLGDKRARVEAVYGRPNSVGPSTGGDRELEMLYYAFDWAGSDVPQVMEIYCDRETGRVMEITLSNPSL